MAYDPVVDKDNYPAGYNAGWIASQKAERALTKELRRNTVYFLGVAIDYIETIKGLNTDGIVSKFEQFREEVLRGE